MALYKNAYELAQKRKNKEDFVSALSEANDSNIGSLIGNLAGSAAGSYFGQKGKS